MQKMEFDYTYSELQAVLISLNAEIELLKSTVFDAELKQKFIACCEQAKRKTEAKIEFLNTLDNFKVQIIDQSL